jgi:hypothetical protein
MITKRTKPLTLKEITRINQGSLHSSQLIATKLAEALVISQDGEKEARLAVKRCAGCYYLSYKTYSQDPELWTCYFCSLKGMHPKACLPKACLDCSDTFEVCRQCLGSLDMMHKTSYNIKRLK